MKMAVVCGDDEYAVYNCIKELVSSKSVTIVDDEDSLGDIMSPFYHNMDSIHVYKVEVKDFNRISEMCSRSRLKFIIHVTDAEESFVKKTTEIKTFSFFLPRKYKLEKYAIGFCSEDAKRLGKSIDDGTSLVLTSIVGSNTWFLHHEMLKLSYLVEAEGLLKIRKEHVFKVVSRFGDYPFDNLMRSIRIRNPQMLSRELNRIELTNGGDPTLRVVRFLSPFVSKLVISEYLRSKGKNEETISEELGINKWYYVNNIHSGNWNHTTLLSVLESLAISERLVLESSVSPWDYLSSRLISLCLGQQQERK